MVPETWLVQQEYVKLSTLFDSEKPMWVDPASGWMYGFPCIWYPERETFEELLDRHRYPERLWGFPCRFWDTTDEDIKGEV